MATTSDSCRVCGGNDMQLSDGYYYCVECGTQDANFRETLIEYNNHDEGPLVYARVKKIHVIDSNLNPDSMSLDWHKWHLYNFVLVGLADELIDLGAAKSFKIKLLWIWSEYVKKFRKPSDEVDASQNPAGATFVNLGRSSFFHTQEDIDDDASNNADDKDQSGESFDMNVCTLATLVSMLYIALNFDDSEIQLSDLCRFIREDRLSVRDFMKFVPKELKCEKIDNWNNFVLSKRRIKSPKHIRRISMKLAKTLKLGTPNCPNIHKIIHRYLIELCMPTEFEALVFSIMSFIPVNLNVVSSDNLDSYPDYEGYSMAYIVVAFKMAFGLDDSYECDLSDAIAEINLKFNHKRCFKSSLLMGISSRYFSFREWSNFMTFKLATISKFFFPMAIIENPDDIDNRIFLSSTKERVKIFESSKSLSDDVTMETLKKLMIKNDLNEMDVVFPPSLTPLSTYTEMILPQISDCKNRDDLCEDFCTYSLDYITQNFALECDFYNVFTGCSLKNKTVVKRLKSKCLTNPLRMVKKNVLVVNNEHKGSSSFEVQQVKLAKRADTITAEINVTCVAEECKDDTYSECTATSSSVNAYDEKFDIEDVSLMKTDDSRLTSNSELQDSFQQTDDLDFDPGGTEKEEAINLLLQAANSRFSLLNLTFPATRKRKTQDTPAFGDGLISSLTTPTIRNKRKSVCGNIIQNSAQSKELDESVNDYFKQLLQKLRTNEKRFEVVEPVCTNIADHFDQNATSDADLTTQQSEIPEFNETQGEINDSFSLGDETAIHNTITVELSTGALNDATDLDEQTITNTNKGPNASANVRESSNNFKMVNQSELLFRQDQPSEPLLSNVACSGSYHYWLRHYSWELKTKSSNLFECELSESFPKSFAWLLRICASMIESNTIGLYTYVMFLEKMLKSNVSNKIGNY